MATTTDIGFVREHSSGQYTATLLDEDGNPISDGDLGTLTLSLYDTQTRTYINGREQQNAINDNDVTINNGALVWNITPDDHIILGIRGQEHHRAVFDYTWTSAGHERRDWHALEFVVQAEFAVA